MVSDRCSMRRGMRRWRFSSRPRFGTHHAGSPCSPTRRTNAPLDALSSLWPPSWQPGRYENPAASQVFSNYVLYLVARNLLDAGALSLQQDQIEAGVEPTREVWLSCCLHLRVDAFRSPCSLSSFSLPIIGGRRR